MRVYQVISDFDLTPMNVALTVGDVVGKLDGAVAVTVNSIQYANQALYDWVGSANSAEELQFVGTIPDPPVGGGVPATPVAVPATPTSAGSQGTWSYDGTYFYWCVANNTWVRWVVVTSW